jgi:hypothetical protein
MGRANSKPTTIQSLEVTTGCGVLDVSQQSSEGRSSFEERGFELSSMCGTLASDAPDLFGTSAVEEGVDEGLRL